jgi:hypothetical protein
MGMEVSTQNRKRIHRILTWKTLRGKNHESPQTPNYHSVRRIQQGAQRQQPLAHNLRLAAVTTETQSLYIALSLSLSLTHYTEVTPITLSSSFEFALGHIYTNMTFRLFTYIAPVGSLEHIYIYVPSIR